MRTFSFFCLVALASLASGCIHRTIRQRIPAPQAISAAPVARSAARRVAVVFVPPQLERVYESHVNADTYFFSDIEPFYAAAFQSALAGRVGALTFASGQPPPGFDVYLYPQLVLRVRVETGFFNQAFCTAEYGLTAADASGRVIAQQRVSEEQSFVLLPRANDACQLAMSRAFIAASWPVLGAVDAQ